MDRIYAGIANYLTLTFPAFPVDAGLVAELFGIVARLWVAVVIFNIARVELHKIIRDAIRAANKGEQ